MNSRVALALISLFMAIVLRYYVNLDRDQSSYWFIVPVDKRKEWEDWNNLDDDDPDAWDAPEWAKAVGGSPNAVTFTNPKNELDEQIVISYFLNKYKKQIESEWNWDTLREDAFFNTDDEGNSIGSVYLGTVFSLFPSGKYWTFYAASNVSIREKIKDIAYREVLEEVFENRGYYVTCGEGDPCDLYAEFVGEN